MGAAVTFLGTVTLALAVIGAGWIVLRTVDAVMALIAPEDEHHD